jgi:hypothetical protein
MAPLYLRPLRPLSRRQLLGGFTAMAASSLLSGCGASLTRAMTSTISAQPTPTQPAPPPPPTPPAITPQPTPSGVITAASMTISSTIVGDLGAGFVGLAYEKQSLLTPLFTAANTGLIALFQMLGPSVLRIGGASVDESVWTPQTSGQTPGQTSGQIAPSDIDALAAFLRATGWSCIYGINLGGSATGATTPALAAAEAAYVSQRLGPALSAIELGNACETYGDPGSFYAGNWSVEIFESLWQQYRSAIVATTPSAPIAGPAAASDIDSWTLPFGEYVTSSEIDLLTQHYTCGPASTATIDGLLSTDPALSAELLQLHYGAQSIGVPFRIDACSAYSNGGAPGISDAYASSLWAIDTIFNTALSGASGLNFQTGGQQPCTPIADNAGVILSAQPLFYGLLLAASAGQGTLLATQLSASALNVTAYALQASDGSMSVVVVNKDAAQSLNLNITLPQSMTSATVQQLTQLSAGATSPSLSALSGVTLQGATIAADGAFQPAAPYALTLNGAQLSCYAPALSAVLIQLTNL